jgi:hypothetical protein
MNKNVSLSKPRQLQLRFEGDEVWERLPPWVGQQCQTLLTQLLVAVLRQEVESFQEANNHERQD